MWVDNIKMDLEDMGLGGVDWILFNQDRERGSVKCWEVLQWLHNWLSLKKGSVPWH
jgi:hypothetical protein